MSARNFELPACTPHPPEKSSSKILVLVALPAPKDNAHPLVKKDKGFCDNYQYCHTFF